MCVRGEGLSPTDTAERREGVCPQGQWCFGGFPAGPRTVAGAGLGACGAVLSHSDWLSPAQI